VVLPKRTYVLPWAKFLYAEGAPDTVRAVFSMLDVVVTASFAGFDERGQDAKCCPAENKTAPKPSPSEKLRRPSSDLNHCDCVV